MTYLLPWKQKVVEVQDESEVEDDQVLRDIGVDVVENGVTLDGKKVGNLMVGNLSIGRAKDSHLSDDLRV